MRFRVELVANEMILLNGSMEPDAASAEAGDK
jgi:hypothetical protein